MRNFFKTVAIVTVFSVCEKFLGFIYRIYLSRSIGAEGIGLYQVALSVFGLIYTVCCSGTPVTVSRFMAKYRAEGDENKVAKIISAGIFFVLSLSIPACIIFFFFSGRMAFLFTDLRCVKIFAVIIPGLAFTSVYSVLRGVFWGNKDFLPYSIIELLEEVCMILVGIFLIERAKDLYQGAYFAGVAVLISFLFSFTLAVTTFILRKNRLSNPKGQFKVLLSSALPVTAMRTANSFTSSLVSIILPLSLVKCGITNAQAMSQLGSAMGQAIPLLSIPTTLIGSFTLVLVPEVSENYYCNRHVLLKNDIEKAIKFTTLLTCLFVPLFTVCGKEIGIVVFGGHGSGEFLTASAFLMIFMGLSSITTSMLNCMGAENKTLIIFTISGFGMLLSVWLLPRFMGVYSLIVGFAIIYGLTTLFNLILLNRRCKLKPQYLKFMLLCFVLLIPSSFLCFMIKKLITASVGNLLSILVCSVITTAFSMLIYFGFNLIDIGFFRRNFKLKNSKKLIRNKKTAKI